MTRLILAMLVMFTAPLAMANGTLAFSIQDQEGFQRLEITETNGVREGYLYSVGGRVPVRSYMKNGELVMQMGSKTNTLKVTDLKSSMLYKGFIDTNKETVIQSYRRPMMGFHIKGKIENVTFDATALPWMRKMNMHWDKLSLNIAGDPNPRKNDGTAKGALAVETEGKYEEIAKFSARSTGTLKDALFKSEQDVLYWLVQLLVVPAD
ncbi:MAG TPA: hypothetical protein VFV50_17490 [Bdellovibrionales bacterium]|nr:hypothetical protein [Bdellovibrionales bacterium]